jgi:N-acetylneuraminic acid mutarotase
MAGAAAGSGGSGAQAGTSSSDNGMPTEKALAKLPAVRQEHSVAALNGEIYVIGGYSTNASQSTDSVIAYDPTKDSWRTVKSFPGPLDHGNAGSVGGKIYIAGFYTNGGMTMATTQVYAYDPDADSWTEKTPLPMNTDRGAACVAIDSGLMYVIGGANGGKSVDNAAVYDPTMDSWKELAPLPERREHCTAGAINGTIYVAGGRVDGITNFEPKTWAYDPATDAWTEKASLPTPRGGLAGAVLGSKLYVFGGEGNSAVSTGVFPNIDVYDPATDKWATIAQMLVPRHGFAAAVLDGKAYLPGGATHQGAGASDNNSVFYLQ